MGNKSLSTPIAPYDQAIQHLNANELTQLRHRFAKMSGGSDTMTQENFFRIKDIRNYPYCRKYILPKLFLALDTKRDGIMDPEEYISAICFFRFSPIEDHMKLLYQMYDGGKSSSTGMNKEGLRQLIIDATIITQRQETPLAGLETWIQGMSALSEAMVETAFVQFTNQAGRMDISEFINYVRVEGTVQNLLTTLPSFIGEGMNNTS